MSYELPSISYGRHFVKFYFFNLTYLSLILYFMILNPVGGKRYTYKCSQSFFKKVFFRQHLIACLLAHIVSNMATTCFRFFFSLPVQLWDLQHSSIAKHKRQKLCTTLLVNDTGQSFNILLIYYADGARKASVIIYAFVSTYSL